MTDALELNEDFADMLRTLIAKGVEFVVVGAHALAAHGVVRSTGDLDILVRPTPKNAQQLTAALREFGAPMSSHGVSASDFQVEGTVYQLGLPPHRIDVLTTISGVKFEQAWDDSITIDVMGIRFRVLGRKSLRVNKIASGRPKDLEDVRRLDAVYATDVD